MCHCDGPEHQYDPTWCRPTTQARENHEALQALRTTAAVYGDITINGVLYRPAGYR